MFIDGTRTIGNIKGGRNKSAVLYPRKIKVLQEIMHNLNGLFCISRCFSISVRRILHSVSQKGFGGTLSGSLVRLLWDGLRREDDLPHLLSSTKHGRAESFARARGCQSPARLSCLPRNGTPGSAGLHPLLSSTAHPQRGRIPPVSARPSLEGLSPATPQHPRAHQPPTAAALLPLSSRLGVHPISISDATRRYCRYLPAALTETSSSRLSLLPQGCFGDLICPLPPHRNPEHLSVSPSVPPPSVRPSLNLASPLLHAIFQVNKVNFDFKLFKRRLD